MILMNERINTQIIETSDKEYIPEVKSTVTPPNINKDYYRVYMLSQQTADVPKAEMVSVR